MDNNIVLSHLAEATESSAPRLVRVVNEMEKTMFCPICYKGYVRKSYFERHIERHVLSRSSYNEDGSITEPNAQELNEEQANQPGSSTTGDESDDSEYSPVPMVLIEPNPSVTYRCEVCEDEFTSELDFLEHKSKHDAGVLMIECKPCGKKFNFWKTFCVHLTAKHKEFLSENVTDKIDVEDSDEEEQEEMLAQEVWVEEWPPSLRKKEELFHCFTWRKE